ncbi:DUF1996 domain-containing protein [Granulosicoccus sp.]|nr:DUF1996 domain-containing protein [Granulosicoccus sp.]
MLTPSYALAESQIVVRAKGNAGQETVDLYVNGVSVKSWRVSSTYQTFSYISSANEPVNSVRIGHQSGDWPNAVIVDNIEVNGTRYESEDSRVRSFGSWNTASGCAEGNKRSEWLSCNGGWFDYPVRNIEIRARGNQGGELVLLSINGEQLPVSWEVTSQYRTFTHTVRGDEPIESVTVSHQSGDWPNAVIVDYIDVNTTRYQSEDPSVRSYGSHDTINKCAEGYKRSEWLSCNNGWFEYLINTSTNTPQPPVEPETPATDDESVHLAMLKATNYRNRNHDDSGYTSTPSADLPIDSFLVPWQEYVRQTGELTRVIPGSGAFRVVCEFSHFAYDDPIIFPNNPGAAHLHMFFGNTDANAYSTADSLLNSGSSTCNGQELNRTAYWIPAFIDENGDIPVPHDAMVYYKGYYTDPSDTREFEVYPPGMRLVSGDAMASSQQAGHRSFRELFFRCYKPGTGGGNEINVRSVTIPSCASDFDLEVNVRFQTCWNGQNPADYLRNAAFSDVWPTSGSCPSSHPHKLPQLEYRIFYRDHAGSSNWILSSDVNMADRTSINGRGYSLHGDWFGGWNAQVNQRWIDNCVNMVDTDCDEGLLSDDDRDPGAQGLMLRPPYTGPSRMPGAAILSDLCQYNKPFTGQTSVALCNN